MRYLYKEYEIIERKFSDFDFEKKESGSFGTAVNLRTPGVQRTNLEFIYLLNILRICDSREKSWMQFVLEVRIFQLSETARAMWACKLTGLTSVSISDN